MRFSRFQILGAYPDATEYFRIMESIKRHWRSLGWEEIPPADEARIREAWSRHLQPGDEVMLPSPIRSWDLEPLACLGERAEAIESEFTLKLLAAFRRCITPGDRLLVIDWQHDWYYFDPHAGICSACRDEWAVPVLPDGDSYNYVAADFRFGVVSGWGRSGPLNLFGRELLSAFTADPPQHFLAVCGPGVGDE